MSQDPIDFETPREGETFDETDIAFRAYLASLSDDHLREYDPSWSDDEVKEWNGNFRSDDALMLVCCERDIEIDEFRRVLEEHLVLRGLAKE